MKKSKKSAAPPKRTTFTDVDNFALGQSSRLSFTISTSGRGRRWPARSAWCSSPANTWNPCRDHGAGQTAAERQAEHRAANREFDERYRAGAREYLERQREQVKKASVVK